MSTSVKRKKPNGTLPPRKKHVLSNDKVRSVERDLAAKDNKLKWKEVKISRSLDDAEGFYGLEEISDVEVVKDENGHGVLFRKVDGASLIGDENADTLEDGEEWSGFGGDDDAQDAKSAHEQGGDSSQTSSIKQNTNKAHKDNRKDKISKSMEELDQNARFDVLDEDANEPEIDMSAWNGVKLSQRILYALSALEFAAPTPIQKMAIPLVTAGKDLIGKAVTGSGKTLAFGLPIIDRWLDSSESERNGPIALILAPTRELAHQITKHLTAVCGGLDSAPRLVTVTGGLSVLKQQRQLEHADIVVGTPGRLWEVITESNELLNKLRQIRFLVVDEADRLLSEGHFKEVEDILDALDRQTADEGGAEQTEQGSPKATKAIRQTLVFSATFHKGLQQRLATRSKYSRASESSLLSNKDSLEYLIYKLPFQHGQKPSFVDANPDSQLAENLTENILECKAMEKDLYLYTFLLLDQHQRKNLSANDRSYNTTAKTGRILVFTNSVSAVKRLVPLLQSLNLPSTSISPLHSNMPQKSRLRSLERFSGKTDDTKHMTTSVLVATDVAARGLDIKGITTIVHYHVPRTADTYVHRSGRTARIHGRGSSVLLSSPDETASVTKLIAKIHLQAKSGKDMANIIDRTYLPGDLIRQVQRRVELAQKLVESNQSTEKVSSEENWLRKAADELGVDYDSEEFEQAGMRGRRGRGAGKDRKQRRAVEMGKRQNKAAEWKALLREDLQKRIDFGQGPVSSMKYLAGGAFDVDKLLAERAQK